MKRLILMIVVLVFTSAVMVFAEEGIMKFTYESALEAAAYNSVQPALDDYNIKALESALEDAVDKAKKGFIGGTPQEVVERTIVKEVNPLEAKINLEIGQRQKLDNEKKIKEEVYKEMVQVVLAEEKIRLKKEQIELSQEKYAIDLVKFKEGLLSEAEITDEELALSIEKLELTKMETALKSDILDVKQKLHIDLEEENRIGFEYKLLKIGSSYTLSSFDLKQAIEKAIESNLGVFGKQKALEMAEMKMEITKKYLKPGNNYYDKRVYEMEAARKSLYDEKTGLEVSIRNAYNNLLTSLDALELEYKKEELENSRLSTLMVKHNAGVISRRDIIDTKIKVLVQQQATLEAVYDYNLKIEAFKVLVEN